LTNQASFYKNYIFVAYRFSLFILKQPNRLPMNNTHIAIGIDIGGSHISCGAVDLKINQLIAGSCFEAKVDNTASADEIFTAWTGAINKTIEVAGKNEIAGIGFAMPGPFDYANGIGLFEGNEKYLSLYGVHVYDEIRKRLGLPETLPVRFINDATAFAIAESWIGIGKGTSRILALTLGTGFGTAFLEDGIPVVEGDSVPEMGCLWYIPLMDGIADDYFSTRWFERSYKKLTGKKVNGVKGVAELFENDEVARQLFVEFGTNMGNFLAPWIKKFNVGQIVMGGNVTGAFDKFGPHLLDAFTENGIQIEVSISELRENAAIIGSARLIDDAFFAKIEPLYPKM
jgi:glucokinase